MTCQISINYPIVFNLPIIQLFRLGIFNKMPNCCILAKEK